MRMKCALFVALLLGACGDDTTNAGGTQAGTGGNDDTTTGVGSSTVTPSATSDLSTSSSTATSPDTADTTSGASEGSGSSEFSTTGEPPAEPFCGDGVVDPLEECDDGNDDDADACSSDCIPTAAIVWTTTVDGVDGLDECLRDVAVGADGAVWATGRMRTLDTERDVWTGHFDADGVLIASHQYNHTDDDHDTGTKVVVDASGDAFVAARVQSVEGDVDVRLSRLSPAGEELWGVVMSDVAGSSEQPTGLAASGTGELIVSTGSFFDDGPQATLGRFTVEGLEVEVSTWTNPSYFEASLTDLVRVGDQLRATAIYADPRNPFAAQRRLAIPSFSLVGVPGETIDVAPPIELSDPVHLAAGPSGELVVAAYDEFSDGIPVVRVFDATQTLVQAWVLDASFPDGRAHDVGVDADGRIVLVGRYDGQLWARKHEPDGTIIWDRTLEARPLQSEVNAIDFAPNGDIVMAGCLDGDLWLGRFTP